MLHGINFDYLEIRFSNALEKDLENYMLSPEVKSKFDKFLTILEDLQRTTTWVQMFRWRRAMVIIMNLLRNFSNNPLRKE